MAGGRDETGSTSEVHEAAAQAILAAFEQVVLSLRLPPPLAIAAPPPMEVEQVLGLLTSDAWQDREAGVHQVFLLHECEADRAGDRSLTSKGGVCVLELEQTLLECAEGAGVGRVCQGLVDVTRMVLVHFKMRWGATVGGAEGQDSVAEACAIQRLVSNRLQLIVAHAKAFESSGE